MSDEKIARITDKSGDFNETCTLALAEHLLAKGMLESYDGVAEGEHCYTLKAFYADEVRREIRQTEKVQSQGPWVVEPWGDNEYDIHDARDYLVCSLRDGDTSPFDKAASLDANLIAAAPELLAALKSLKALLPSHVWDQLPGEVSGGYDQVNQVADAIESAINKAEGGKSV